MDNQNINRQQAINSVNRKKLMSPFTYNTLRIVVWLVIIITAIIAVAFLGVSIMMLGNLSSLAGIGFLVGIMYYPFFLILCAVAPIFVVSFIIDLFKYFAKKK